MRVSLSKAVALHWEKHNGMLLFAFLFLLVAACSLSSYYAQVVSTKAPAASIGLKASAVETACDGVLMPPATVEHARGQVGEVTGLD